MDLNEKIKIEKRKRHQVYMSLDYLKSHKNKFDFFSADIIQVLKISKNLAKKFNKKNVTAEILLLAFFYFESDITLTLSKFNITFENLYNCINYTYTSDSQGAFFDIRKNITSFFKKESNFETEIQSNFEVRLLLEKAVDNCYRFKTPILTTEILLLTLLEEKNFTSGELLKLIVTNEIDWNLLRYEILKSIHTQETKIQGNLVKSARYFGYLLKSELTDYQFAKLLKKVEISSIVLEYRDLLIQKLLGLDIFNSLENEIKFSIKSTKTRKYLN